MNDDTQFDVTAVGPDQAVTPVTYSNNTNAGMASASASYAGDANHNGSTGMKSITILKANATVNVAGYSGVYDGAAHGASGRGLHGGSYHGGHLRLLTSAAML